MLAFYFSFFAGLSFWDRQPLPITCSFVNHFICSRPIRFPDCPARPRTPQEPGPRIVSVCRLVTLVALRIKDRRHVAGDPHLEMIFHSKPAQTSGYEMYAVFAWLGIGMIHVSALDGHAVAEIPAIRECRGSATAAGREPQRGSRISFRRMVRAHAGSNCRDVAIHYLQHPH